MVRTDERTDSERNFILLSEHFNLWRVTLSLSAIETSDPAVTGARGKNVGEYGKFANEQPPSANRCDCDEDGRDSVDPVPDYHVPDYHDRTCRRANERAFPQRSGHGDAGAGA